MAESRRLVHPRGQAHQPRQHRPGHPEILTRPEGSPASSAWGRVLGRLAQSIVVVFLVTTIAFLVIRSAPGDPFSYDSPDMTSALRAQLRQQFGYDRPLGEQYVRYLANVAHGQLGYSLGRHELVSATLATVLPRTLLLTGLALVLSFAIGMAVGVVQATHRGRWFDRVSSGALVFFYALPDFWGALMILLIFAYWIHDANGRGLLPAGGMVDVMHDYLHGWAALRDWLVHLVLPVGALTLLTTASIARYQRSSMLEVLPADFIRTARAKGLPERAVVWRHGFRNALTSMITLGGLYLPMLLGGALFVETVFAWPGMGYAAATAIGARDYDLVIATVIVGSVLVVIGNLLADLAHVALDPRLRD